MLQFDFIKNYYGTYFLNNGQLLEVYKIDNKLVDGNGILITEEELQQYKKLD